MGSTATMESSAEISMEARAKARKCLRKHACINGEQPACKAVRRISKGFLFVSDGKVANCPYGIPFGTSAHICTCPVRYELFEKEQR